MKLSTEKTVLGQTVRMTVEVIGEGQVRDEALGRMQGVMMRETQRFAEIAGVDIRDQPIEQAEFARLKKLGPAENRPHIILAQGTKGTVEGKDFVVERGEFHIAGKKVKAKSRPQAEASEA